MWTVRDIAKPAGLSVRCIAPAARGLFVVGYFAPADPKQVAPYVVCYLNGGTAQPIAELPFPVALAGDGAGNAICGTHGGLWTCTTRAAFRLDARQVSALARDQHHAYWATGGDLLRVSLSDGNVDVLGRWGARITALAHYRGTLYWLGVAGALPPPEVLPGGFAIMPLDDAPRSLYARATAGGATQTIALPEHPTVAVAADATGVFVLTRGGAPEDFDGHVLHLAHGTTTWRVIASGRKLPSHLVASDRGVVWSHERELGYVIEGCVGGQIVTLVERTNSELVALAAGGGGELVASELRLRRLATGATLVTSEYALYAAHP